MCLSKPGLVIQVNDGMALVEVHGKAQWFNALTEPALKAGDFVLTHTGLIIAILTQAEAVQLDLELREMENAALMF